MHAGEFESRIAGIPCTIRVLEYTAPQPMLVTGSGFGDAEPPVREDWDFDILDRRGRRADWLAEKLTPADEQRLLDEFRALREEGGY